MNSSSTGLGRIATGAVFLAAGALWAAAALGADAGDKSLSRNLIERILADEEQHLSWLETEIELCARLGDALYIASRLQAVTT